MVGDLGHLEPFYQRLHGPYQPDGSYDGMPGRDRFVSIFYREGMELPPGSELRGSWIVPTVLAGPSQTWRSAGLLPVLLQEEPIEQLRGDGGVVVHNAQAEQFSLVQRVDQSGILLGSNLKNWKVSVFISF